MVAASPILNAAAAAVAGKHSLYPALRIRMSRDVSLPSMLTAHRALDVAVAKELLEQHQILMRLPAALCRVVAQVLQAPVSLWSRHLF
jgi:hypothetical protein